MRRSMGEQSGAGGGQKKGAHYSAPGSLSDLESPSRGRPESGAFRVRQAPQRIGPLPRILGAICVAAAVTGSLPLALGAPTKTESQAQKAESELQSVKSEIDRITRQVSEEQAEHDRLSQELRSAEVSVGKARETLETIRHERAERAARRATLANEKREAQAS